MSAPIQPITGFFLSTTPIKFKGRGGHATGFFFHDDGSSYLITNKHVFDFKTANNEPVESARIYLRPSPDNVAKTDDIDIELIDDSGEKNWLTHENDTIDLAALPIDDSTLNAGSEIKPHTADSFESGNLALSSSDLPILEETHVPNIKGGTQIMILGYPQQRIPQKKYPVARNGLISTPYGETYRNRPMFLTDAKTHQGLSGSPILATPTSTGENFADSQVKTASKTMRDASWWLLGIHSGERNVAEPLGLNESWYGELLLDITRDIE